MKFIELHCATGSYFFNFEKITSMQRDVIRGTYPEEKTKIQTSTLTYYCKETPEEIIQKIAEATQSERAEIFQKFVEAEQCERSCMDD